MESTTVGPTETTPHEVLLTTKQIEELEKTGTTVIGKESTTARPTETTPHEVLLTTKQIEELEITGTTVTGKESTIAGPTETTPHEVLLTTKQIEELETTGTTVIGEESTTARPTETTPHEVLLTTKQIEELGTTGTTVIGKESTIAGPTETTPHEVLLTTKQIEELETTGNTVIGKESTTVRPTETTPREVLLTTKHIEELETTGTTVIGEESTTARPTETTPHEVLLTTKQIEELEKTGTTVIGKELTTARPTETTPHEVLLTTKQIEELETTGTTVIGEESTTARPTETTPHEVLLTTKQIEELETIGTTVIGKESTTVCPAVATPREVLLTTKQIEELETIGTTVISKESTIAGPTETTHHEVLLTTKQIEELETTGTTVIGEEPTTVGPNETIPHEVLLTTKQIEELEKTGATVIGKESTTARPTETTSHEVLLTTKQIEELETTGTTVIGKESTTVGPTETTPREVLLTTKQIEELEKIDTTVIGKESTMTRPTETTPHEVLLTTKQIEELETTGTTGISKESTIAGPTETTPHEVHLTTKQIEELETTGTTVIGKESTTVGPTETTPHEVPLTTKEIEELESTGTTVIGKESTMAGPTETTPHEVLLTTKQIEELETTGTTVIGKESTTVGPTDTTPPEVLLTTRQIGELETAGTTVIGKQPTPLVSSTTERYEATGRPESPTSIPMTVRSTMTSGHEITEVPTTEGKELVYPITTTTERFVTITPKYGEEVMTTFGLPQKNVSVATESMVSHIASTTSKEMLTTTVTGAITTTSTTSGTFGTTSYGEVPTTGAPVTEFSPTGFETTHPAVTLITTSQREGPETTIAGTTLTQTTSYKIEQPTTEEFGQEKSTVTTEGFPQTFTPETTRYEVLLTTKQLEELTTSGTVVITKGSTPHMSTTAKQYETTPYGVSLATGITGSVSEESTPMFSTTTSETSTGYTSTAKSLETTSTELEKATEPSYQSTTPHEVVLTTKQVEELEKTGATIITKESTTPLAFTEESTATETISRSTATTTSRPTTQMELTTSPTTTLAETRNLTQATLSTIPGYTRAATATGRSLETTSQVTTMLTTILTTTRPVTLVPSVATENIVPIANITEKPLNLSGICCQDSECPETDICLGKQCVNVCKVGGMCAPNAICVAVNRSAVCSCPPRHFGDPRKKCIQAPPSERAPKPCKSDMDCLESEACYMSLCQDPCEFTDACAKTAVCQAKMHRPICTCPMGYEGNPATNCFKSSTTSCSRNEDCPHDEACIDHACQRPCDVRNPCAQHAVCINVNHGSDCSCEEGFQGNGYVGCTAVIDYKPICQYNEDCPPNKLCDRLNRICINPCFEDSCGENAECIPKDHGIDCRCLPGHQGNPFVECLSVQGCRSDAECASNEACLNGECASPCRCGTNAICEVNRHVATCKCPPGYQGDAHVSCQPPQNPCDPNPCGLNALCELDNGNPICFCPKGLTGNPFKNCIPEGDECKPNPCGPNSGCRVVGGNAVCFCLPEFEGTPPHVPCALPQNPCDPSPCGPNTQCTILSNGFAKCTCLPGFLESPNTIRGCVEAKNPCEPNPCGQGAICDPLREPVCVCPVGTVGNPFRSCSQPKVTPLCSPGPCGPNADCYVSNNQEQCYCRSGYIGNPYSGCRLEPPTPCTPNPCGPGAQCVVTPDGNSMCQCPDGMGGDPTGPAGCHGYECVVDENCPDHQACIGYKCKDPCPGCCGINALCRVEQHHPICTCRPGFMGNPPVRCYPQPERMPDHDPCLPSPCGENTVCQSIGGRAVCSCLPDFNGDPQTGCRPECTLNTECPLNKACVNRHCVDPCSLGNLCGLHATCQVRDHIATCLCPDGYMGDAFLQCIPTPTVSIPTYPNATIQPCLPSPCGEIECSIYGTQIAICDPCLGPGASYNPQCRPECLINADCPFDKACLGFSCTDPCPGSCGVNAECSVISHTPVCSCPTGLVGDPFQHCSVPLKPDHRVETCETTRCGANAICKDHKNAISCICKKGYYGNPWIACRPECVVNPDCPLNKACISNKCVDPCAGVCGVGAQCEVTNHIPICFCPPQTTGDPFITCYPHTSTELVPISPNPCDPSPCGPFSRCLVSHQGFATCSCLPGYWGAPPACKPECIVSSECPQTQACINKKCVNPCAGTCGANALCTVINHNPICSCPPGQQGDPFSACYTPEVPQLPKTPENPCVPTPCGPNSICQVKQGRPVCSCDKNYIGTPPYCRPECTLNQECPQNKACIKEKCMDPCIELCGRNAKCNVINHQPFCACLEGFQGDAFIGCSKIPKPLPAPDPCHPSPCGENAQCSVSDGVARCTCIPPYIGNPYVGGCRPECTMNSECPSHLACLSQHCRDPCQGLCGINAECSVVNHVPVCTCGRGLIGDPFTACRQAPPQPPSNPCEPSPCGPNSVCRVRNDQAICSCQIGYFGTPPLCRPECLVTSECSLDKACINQKCQDPCPGTCGVAARCQVNNHNPICSCPPNYVGDPFVQCTKQVKPPPPPVSPCVPSPCGVNSECKAAGNRAVCTCLPGMFGAPPNCRPECLIDQDCPLTLACLANKCRDPCVGTCGFNAQCNVVNHRPICSCLGGFEGDPFTECAPIRVIEEPRDPCHPSPCGSNAVCTERNGAGACACIEGYFGDPYSGCRPECVTNNDCPHDKACLAMKCVDPCTGCCGVNAECRVIHHNPQCHCLPGFTGNALLFCREIEPIAVEIQPKPRPCSPSPCGPYSICREVDDRAVCSCSPSYVGAPPNCRPECVVNSECPQNRACHNQKCIDPCPGTCGYNALCRCVVHSPICSCPPGWTGDPFIGCVKEEKRPAIVHKPVNPCIPTPCGLFSECKVISDRPVCSCLPNYFGHPPNCRPECTVSSECPSTRACVNQKCVDPCSGSCGANSECRAVSHTPVCYCSPGFTGDPFSGCYQLIIKEEPAHPCNPSPCGANAICKEQNGAGSCSCLPEYFGDPYSGCRPECVMNSDCSKDKSCVNNKCKDPCPGTCGINADCRVTNHVPTCSCLPGFTGDPLRACHEPPKARKPEPARNPCDPSPCGPNSQCRVVGNTPACSCLPNFVGHAPNCRPECVINAECPGNLACQREKCTDPCPGSCGTNTECTVVSHRPVCSCRAGYTGDPFAGCSLVPIVQPTEAPPEPCNPSPCGANAICKERNGVGSCTCIPEYFGDPYTGCRPECVTNSDCPREKACINNKCKDPCPGTCGINAECNVVNHSPSCSCLPGYTGNPLTSCRQPPPTPEPRGNPCVPSPCGPYSVCREVDGHAVCSCQANYIGTPPACRPECMVSSECPQNRACINNKCKDPCPGTCGINARCQVVNHNPICSCPQNYVGDPFVRCVVEEKKLEPTGDPCLPTPCGPNSQCKVVGNQAACSCLPNFIGRPPNCRAECTINAECPGNLACQNEKCRDPCPGSCGSFTSCVVVKHAPVCRCVDGYTGDPFTGCSLIPPTAITELPPEPCNPSPCGANAICKERNGAGACSCLPEYFGDPYTGCRPECVTNSECDRSRACVNNKCVDPCPGTCGLNAECRVINHAPSCTCIPGYTGDPITACQLVVSPVVEEPPHPCQPSPCGPYSQCREVNGHAVCTCNVGYIGTPPACRPECMVSSECPQDKACVKQKCVDPCPGTCGLSANCKVVNHNPICSCSGGLTGDPFIRCVKIESPPPPKQIGNPCIPSPCGPNSQCRVVGSQPACSCLPNFIGRPPNCRPECINDSECPNNLACRNEKCTDPCPGSCGVNAQCTVVNHSPTCSCLPGYIGDPFNACSLPPPSTERTPASPCSPSPCGPNADCQERNGAGACLCRTGFMGDPYDQVKGCHRECELHSDCKSNLACISYKCVDPCPGTCGDLAECHVHNHIPNCVCPSGYTGDPFLACKLVPEQPRTPENPCQPSPCGPNSQCRNVKDQAVCSCLPTYVGSPPNCRPECIVSSECPADRACINQRCSDPCPNTCGLKAVCTTKNHNPICACPPGFTGDPFTRCVPQPVEEPPTTERPPSCFPSPCGPNSQCKIVGNTPTCSCLPDHIGSPPNCRPECVLNSECGSQLACINQKCKDPCPGSCGVNAQCHIVNHLPICTCIEGHTGDPFTQCNLIPPVTTPPPPTDPCNPSPCGPNAECNNGICTCLPEYIGNPYESCRPECVLSNECSRDKACIRNKCKDPCPGTCGQNARCDVINHIPSCSCPDGFTGDPFTNCRVSEQPPPRTTNPCIPSPCGPNSQCKNINDHAVCSCLQGYQGAPPSCRPECLVSAECPQNRACVNQKCIDPCPGSCGVNARCEVRNHSPICSCPEGQTGDPFQSCREIPKLPPAPPKKVDPCLPSPCGPNSICRRVGDQPSCTCLNGYIGNPPNCRPECVINPDCPSTEACINNKCKDPCPGSCGDNAECKVITHTVSCSCSPGYTGNPFIQCVIQEVKTNPCEPSPCGANAECTQRNGAGACRCIQDYMGNPYEGCRPECVLSSDCPTNKACMRNKCGDPCPGVCGKNAECAVINHVPTCTCLPGHVGDPFGRCVPALPPPTEKTAVDPCSPTPCGPYSQCRNVNDQAVCSCLPEYTGTPPNCKPECVVSSECPQNRACHKFKCANPCAGTCGLGARCEVINHNPICSCPERMTGDPFTRCHEIPPPPTRTETRPIDPCRPSPCGPNSECRAVGDQPSCSCKANFVGSPPNCRPECVVNTDCSSSLACITEKCRDPCPGSCGFNAECRVQNHIPVCTCQSGFTGDAFTECSRIPPPKPEAKPNPCDPSPCGQNAQCRDGICSCLPEYQGDPYQGCRPECTMNTDCSPTKACINLHCVDPCPGTCGQNALCDIVNHIPTCSCPQGHEGDPFTLCRPKRPEPPLNPCQPSPCGPNSACRVNNGVAVCSCLPGLVGSPPSCRPECVVSAECALTQACLNNKCVDPCPGTCGVAAKCQVVNHNPICSCDSGHTGDPFTRCYPIPKVSPPPTPADPCRPSPCGPNAACRVVKGSPACSCLEPYVGAPPNCRPECTISPECPPTKACLNQRCRDPCPGSCGQNALCTVINHGAVCSCSPGHTGDPFRGCIPTPAPPPPKPTPREPCSPSPCGANAICRVENQVAVCQCLPEYRGNPYESCRPECLSNSECPGDRACIRNKCQDPCPGTCGINAECLTRNHVPVCTCLRGYQGDAFRVCSRVIEEPPRDPCNPSPCGINTVCRTSGKTAVCECLPGFQGNPSAGGCRPECTISADCPRDRACVNTKCVDPCPGTCGFNALCNVINHSPVCSCPPPLAGDPFTLCKEEKIIPKDPCNPSPCNPNGQCRVVNGQAVCIYPECIINQDCPRDKACYSQKCRDPCRDACGLNALCQVVNHRVVCSCPQGYVGTPEVQCRLQPKEEPKPKVECTSDSDCTNDKACINTQCRNPCSTSSCGQNAECRPQLHRAVCTCRDGFTGNAQRFCQEIGCRSDSECPPTQACINKECTDPCSFTSCGLNALCRADSNHRARCYCPDNFRGDPLVRCERPECTKDDDCPYNLACRHEKCENPCNCGLGAICNVFNHRPQCSCPSGYIGNPLQSCKQKPAELEPECRMDADCPSKKACFGGVCKNPCLETKPCGRNAECIVVDSLPLRTMSCMCLPGYIGDADTECRLAPHEEPGCKSNSDCGPTETCLNRICVNPCVIGHPCDTTALCTAQDHKATCRCPPGLIGDPFVRCYEQPKTKVECTSDLQCSNDKSCINQRCQDHVLCPIHVVQTLNAKLASIDRHVCVQAVGWETHKLFATSPSVSQTPTAHTTNPA
ncbi:unnamed protein product [Callosobruchus maculatus]|uniref:EGF-like domain-containing protein n=1 Tax=Callosobruchus maculatus TaxID=64391 RepID=A0A653CE82_CALMS|nr:unnamed protein product [Callosobruchus maculatus]